ncbi:M20/M25/M40 family metallo-hydrolase [Streptomyces sp. 8N114]|uniref:M20/M25/M40 family metallo-hydrolase n=1 Tax=Streptomyces sp. 8N114 TaxID=3457419 RepID=UPI003FD3CD0F
MMPLDTLVGRTDEIVEQTLALCRIESPSDDLPSLAAVTDAAAELGERLTGRAPVRIAEQGRPALLWEPAPDGVLLLGHLDTVWPLGTLAGWAYPQRTDEVISAPGVFDMKAGVVQGFHAMAAIGSPAACGMLLTTDEELGSPVFRPVVERVAADAGTVLVLEASADGALKTGRKGAGRYTVRIHGKAAHAGLEPEHGVNALRELAEQVRVVASFGTGELTVTPTVAAAGTTGNTVPADASFVVDVRAATRIQQDDLHARITGLNPVLPGARVDVNGGPTSPPMEAAQAQPVFAVAREVAAGLGLGELRGVSVGGGSDGNFTASIGVPTLDGLGAVGAHAHAEGEYVVIAEAPRRAALLAGLIDRLIREPLITTAGRPAGFRRN